MPLESRERAKTKDTQFRAEEVCSVMPPSEGLKTPISCAMTAHLSTWRWQCGTCLERTCMARADVGSTRHCQKVTNSRESWHDWNEASMERNIRRQSGATCGRRNKSRQASTWDIVSSRVLWYIRVRGDVARVVPWRRLRGSRFAKATDGVRRIALTWLFEVRQTGHIGFNRTISINIELHAMVFETDQCHVSKVWRNSATPVPRA